MKHANKIRWGTVAASAAMTGLLLTGCANEPPAAAPQQAAQKPAQKTTTTTTTTTAKPPPPTPKAADRRKYSVCARRSCEVAVSKPVEIRFGGSAPGTLKVKKVASDEVHMDISLATGGGGEGYIRPGCGTFVFRAYSGGSGTLSGPEQHCVHDMPEAEPGAVTVQVPALASGIAILRIVTG